MGTLADSGCQPCQGKDGVQYAHANPSQSWQSHLLWLEMVHANLTTLLACPCDRCRKQTCTEHYFSPDFVEVRNFAEAAELHFGH